MDKLISVAIPVYNGETTLRKCVDSILAQTYKNIEVILVNDGSTDRSEDICRSYEQADSRVSVISKANGGLSSARNAGIDGSHGEYLFFVDSDDWIDSDTLEVLLKTFTSIVQYTNKSGIGKMRFRGGLTKNLSKQIHTVNAATALCVIIAGIIHTGTRA